MMYALTFSYVNKIIKKENQRNGMYVNLNCPCPNLFLKKKIAYLNYYIRHYFK